MKVYIRTLWGDAERPLWYNEAQREALRAYLHDHGFYVLTGVGDSLDIYAINYAEPWDIILLKKSLDKLSKTWYAIAHKQN